MNRGFETNLNNNSHRKEEKYRLFLKDLNSDYRQVRFFNLPMSRIHVFGQSSDSFLEMCKCIEIDQSHLNCILTKVSSIIIRIIYYIFCSRNKPWSNPELLSYYLILFNNTTCFSFLSIFLLLLVVVSQPNSS